MERQRDLDTRLANKARADRLRPHPLRQGLAHPAPPPGQVDDQSPPAAESRTGRIRVSLPRHEWEDEVPLAPLRRPRRRLLPFAGLGLGCLLTLAGWAVRSGAGALP